MVTEVRLEEIHDIPVGGRIEIIPLEDDTTKEILILSFRNRHHRGSIVGELLSDYPIAFHGWGVSGVCGRVDQQSQFNKFWELKEGRPPGSKIPLLEPPQFATQHIDWRAVHTDFRYLENPLALKRLWSSRLPFHLIFPYDTSAKSLSDAVVTPAFDSMVAPDVPVPTICLFWVDDPAMVTMVKDIKNSNSTVQLGVSSLNESHETPPFNTLDLIGYLKDRQITKYNVVVEDPILEPLDIASSHSQIVVPLVGEDPVWLMKRRGSLSAYGFSKATGFKSVEVENVRVASRKVGPEDNLDDKLDESARRIRNWYLKALFHLV